MKYMEQGGFQNHPHMRLTLGLTLVLLAGFWVSNFLLYFSKMSLDPASVVNYYLGSPDQFTVPRSYQSMVEVTHSHLPIMAVVILLLTHLIIFAPLDYSFKTAFILTAFSSALANEAAGWLIRFVHPGFAYLKILSFVTLQGTLLFLLAALAWFLASSPIRGHKRTL